MTSARERLEDDLREAERELQMLGERLDDKPKVDPGEGSAGAYSWEMALARRERTTERIEDLREALNRIDEGAYGRCERCGAQINPERLEILPTTSLCIACAQRQQAQH